MANITLGPCHYDMDEIAVAVAVRKDGSGWVPVCEDHKGQAESEGYDIQPDVPPEDRADSGTNPDLMGPSEDGDDHADGDEHGRDEHDGDRDAQDERDNDEDAGSDTDGS